MWNPLKLWKRAPAPNNGVPSIPVDPAGLAAKFLKVAAEKGFTKQAESFMLSSMQQFSQTFLGDSGWLTANLPLNPKEQPGTPPRKFQYQPGYNIQIQPRSGESISFPQLRALGDYTLIRVVIERIKEAIKAHEWDIVPDDRSEGMAHEADITAVKKFLEKPDRRHSWDEWVGLLMEEALVIDALSVFVHRNRGGDVWAFEIIDGGTIKVLADERGFEPHEDTGAPAYQQFLYGVPYANFRRDELIYRPRNRRAHKFYGFSPVEQIVIVVNQGLRRELYNLAQFTDGNIPAGVGTVPKEWKPEEIKAYQEYWDMLLSGDLQNRSKLKFVPEGFEYTKFHDEEVFGLFNKFDEWLARVVCYAFGVNPLAFVQMTNRAVAQEMGDQEAEYGFASMKLFIERLMNDIIDNYLMMPHLSFNWITDRGRLQAKRVERNVEYVKAGIFSIDEVREEEGLAPLGIPPGVVGPSGFVPFPVAQPAPFPAEEVPGGGMVDPVAPEAEEFYPTAETAATDPAAFEVADREQPARMELAAKALVRARETELGQWERWALARVGEGKQGGIFKCEFIAEVEAESIRSELTKVKLSDEVRHIFSRRRKAVPPMRLRPPEARDAAHRVGDLRQTLRSILGRESQRIAGRPD